jgi:hypothetical protein
MLKGGYAKLPWFGAYHAVFCREKMPSKKKVTCRLRGTSSSYTVIFAREKGSSKLQKSHFGDDIP